MCVCVCVWGGGGGRGGGGGGGVHACVKGEGGHKCWVEFSLVPRLTQKEGEGSGEYSTSSHYGLAHLWFHK